MGRNQGAPRMTPRQLQLIREYREGIINRKSFVYLWRKEQGRIR